MQTARREVCKPLKMALCLGLIGAHSGVASSVYAGRGRGGGVGSLCVGYDILKMMLFDPITIRYSSVHDGSTAGGVLIYLFAYEHSGWGV